MSDFVAEIRRRTYTPHFSPPAYSPGEFVAEIRPRRNENSEIRNMSIDCHATGVTDQDLQNILTDRHFSRDDITGLLERSILTLVEKLLTGRPLSRVQGNLCVSLSSNESPIVLNFNEAFPKFVNSVGVTEHILENRLNIKVKKGDVIRSSSLGDEESYARNVPLHEFEREPCHSIAEADCISNFPCEYHREGESTASSPPHDSHSKSTYSFPPEIDASTCLQAQKPVSEKKQDCQKRHESDDDSGYTSNDKEDSDTAWEHSSCRNSSQQQKRFSTYNDYYCNGFDGKDTLYTSNDKQTTSGSSTNKDQHSCLSSNDCDDEMDEDEEENTEFDHRLVIDESPDLRLEAPKTNNICCSKSELIKDYDQPMDVGVEDITNSETKRNCLHIAALRKQQAQRCLNNEIEDVDYPISSDITDTDVPVDLSGDSKYTLDVVSATPHPLSLVSRHPEGFRCKQCSQILPDPEAVTKHIQSVHDLFCCTFCCRTFTAKNNLKRHIRIHTGHRPYKCTQCSQSFARRDDLKGHMLRHDYSKPFRCSVCKKGYTDRACVKNHMAKEHRSRLMHVCPQCGESYDQEEAFTAHKKTHPELQQFSCTTCSFIGTNNLMTQKHSLLHTHKLFSCKPCNAYFADPFDYTNHVRMHKKTAAFSQYICCFCDIALSTYDQYIRHEYSHAQGKTHACKTCKKLFKSKSLMQEHSVIHQELGLDKAQTLQIPSEFSENTECYSMYLEPNEISETNVRATSMESEFADEPVNSLTDSAMSEPVACSPPSEVDDQNEFPEQVLDLTMKKPRIQNLSTNGLCTDRTRFHSCLRLSGIREQNIPRNGDVLSESFCLGQDREANEHATRSFQRLQTSCSEDMKSTSILALENTNKDSSMNTDWDNSCSSDEQASRSYFSTVSSGTNSYTHINSRYVTRSTSEEWIHSEPDSPNDKSWRGHLNRRISQEYARRAPLRFSPYSREKMADLAAKFVAARGNKILQQRVPLKPFVPPWENRKETPVTREERTDKASKISFLTPPRWQLSSSRKDRDILNHNSLLLGQFPADESNVVTCRAFKNNDKISCELSNPETALCRAPIVVKSDLEYDVVLDAAGRSRLQEGVDESAKSNVRMMNIRNNRSTSSFSCDDCKEVFASFSELENHSVELHKRFLCEHCKKSFTARPNRDRHVRYHTGERPYKCDLCEMAFFRGDDLKYHRTTRHPTAQPFICTRCSASFTWGRDLDRHIRHSKCQP